MLRSWGIGIVHGLYYNLAVDRYWLIDARIDQPDRDGKIRYERLQDDDAHSN